MRMRITKYEYIHYPSTLNMDLLHYKPAVTGILGHTTADKVALGQVFFEYFGFPYQSSFHQILHHHNHPGQVQ
jgi:hypothetical protein